MNSAVERTWTCGSGMLLISPCIGSVTLRLRFFLAAAGWASVSMGVAAVPSSEGPTAGSASASPFASGVSASCSHQAMSAE